MISSISIVNSELSFPQDLHILLVEDDPGDVELTRIAISNGKTKNTLSIVDTGTKALAYIKREGIYKNEKQPDLVLLDLNIPGLSGFDVLKSLQSYPMPKPEIIVLTTSNNPSDITSAITLGAIGFVTKHAKLTEFLSSISKIEAFIRDGRKDTPLILAK